MKFMVIVLSLAFSCLSRAQTTHDWRESANLEAAPGVCSVNSPPECADKPTWKTECKDNRGMFGNCIPFESVGTDGNRSCLCAQGE